MPAPNIIAKAISAVLAATMSASPAGAFCSYHGVLDAKTTVEQEFHDAQLVVRARVIATDYHWANSGDSWAVYSLKTIERLKGHGSRYFKVFTFRDSGGFYIDKASDEPDFDRDWLLFLNPIKATQGYPPAARDGMEINYACGQSKLWSDISVAEQQQLLGLSRRL